MPQFQIVPLGGQEMSVRVVRVSPEPTDRYEYLLPRAVFRALIVYVKAGRLPGEFLQAVLRNDLFAAASRADAVSKAMLPDLCLFIYNECPAPCWGSPGHVYTWPKLNQSDRERITADLDLCGFEKLTGIDGEIEAARQLEASGKEQA